MSKKEPTKKIKRFREEFILTARGRRRKQNGKAQGKNKPALALQARLRGYLAMIEKWGYSGSTDLRDLPKRWGGFNRPGVG